MQKDLILAIFTPTRSGPGAGMVGTGYPVSDELVLTARHVVAPAGRNTRLPIRVCWYHRHPAGSDAAPWTTIRKQDLVWVGEGDLDAALIRCPRPPELSRYPLGYLASRSPRDGERWQGYGFARANRRDDLREPGHFGGTLRTMAEANRHFELLEDAPPDRPKQWAGVSGMPVCAGEEILGVVRQVPPNYGHAKLEAVPAARLLADPGFREALGLDREREQRLARAREGLSRLLRGSDSATRALAAGLFPDLPREPVEACRRALVDALLERRLPLERLFERALGVQRGLSERGDRNGCDRVRALMLALLPAIQDASVIARVQGDREGGVVALPTRLRTLAEIVMAGVDARPAALRPARTRQLWPEGAYSLPEPPESGLDADGQQFSRDMRAQLLDLVNGNTERLAPALRNYLAQRYIPAELRNAVSQQELWDAVSEELRHEVGAAGERVTYYYAYIAPYDEDAADRARRDAVLAELKAQFPPIAFLRLEAGEAFDRETRRYRDLRDLLWQDPEATP